MNCAILFSGEDSHLFLQIILFSSIVSVIVLVIAFIIAFGLLNIIAVMIITYSLFDGILRHVFRLPFFHNAAVHSLVNYFLCE